MLRTRPILSLAGAMLLSAGCAGSSAQFEEAEMPETLRQLSALDADGPSAAELETIGPESSYVVPNTQDLDGTAAYVHYTREDMPLRVNVDMPRVPLHYANRR